MARGLGLVVYGTEGVGKTSFALEFPKEVLCISVKESGFDDLEMVGQVPPGCDGVDIETFGALIKTMQNAKDYRTVVIDSLSGVQQLMTKDILKEVYNNDLKDFGGFSEGFRIHGPVWAEKVTNAAELLRGAGVDVIFIGHSKIELPKNVNGTDFSTTELDMEKWPRAVFLKWAQAVLYMTLDVEVMNTKSWKGKPIEGKIKQDLEDESDRIMYTSKHPTHSAKNRIGLPVFISMGNSPRQAYENFFKHLPDQLKEARTA
jgi:hypothetical protein